MIDLTAATRKNEIGLYVSREIDGEVFAKTGIKARPDRSWSSNTGYRYSITVAAARKLIKAFPGQVTYYGEPVA